MISITEIIKLLGLESYQIDGGFYSETYRSEEKIEKSCLPERYTSPKSFGTAMYYLLTPQTKNPLHRLPADEIFHFYLGDPVKMLQLHPDGSTEVITLGSKIEEGQKVQVLVPKNVWQGSILIEGGNFALMGTTMAPGFDSSGYEVGNSSVIEKYKSQEELIKKLI